MADENKSFFPNIGLLSDSSLTGLAPELQDQLQREATKRMVLGGLLSGRADVGFQSAIGVPTDYFARQQAIQAQQQQQQLLGARNAAYERVGLPYVQGSEQEKMLAQDVQDFGPDAARTYAALESNRNLPKKFNQEKFAGLASEILAGSDPKGWAEFSKNMRPPSYEPGTILTSPFDPTKILTQMPGGLEKGQEVVIKNGVPTIQYRSGATDAAKAMEKAIQSEKPQEVYDPSTGLYKSSTFGNSINQPTKPGPGATQAETKTAESWAAKQSNFPTAEKGVNAYVEQSKFLEGQVDKAIALAKQRGTTGLIGSQAAKIQGTPAYNLSQLLEPLESGVAFDTIKDLKANDASLGQIAVKEFTALGSSKGSFSQGQSDAQLISRLEDLKRRVATGRDRVVGEYYNIYKDFALTPDRVAPIVEQARQNPFNVPPGFQVRAVGQEQYLVGPHKFFQKIN